MVSERIQRRIDRLLDRIDEAEANGSWEPVRGLALDVLEIDADNVEADAYLKAAGRCIAGRSTSAPQVDSGSALASPTPIPAPPTERPSSFAKGRCQVKRSLGEGGKKKVYLAQDTLLDREVAFALIKTEALGEVSRARITREAQDMGRLGTHPHIVTSCLPSVG